MNRLRCQSVVEFRQNGGWNQNPRVQPRQEFDQPDQNELVDGRGVRDDNRVEGKPKVVFLWP